MLITLKMRFLKIILSVFALFYRLTPNYLIISDVYFLHRKVGRENKRKQIGTLRHIVLIISDLQKQDLRFQQRLKLCSCIVFISDYQRVRCSASESRFCVGKWFFAKKSILSANISHNLLYFKQLIFCLLLQIFDF